MNNNNATEAFSTGVKSAEERSLQSFELSKLDKIQQKTR